MRCRAERLGRPIPSPWIALALGVGEVVHFFACGSSGRRAGSIVATTGSGLGPSAVCFSRELLLDRELQLLRLEAERPLAALEGDPAVAANEVEAVGPAAVGR